MSSQTRPQQPGAANAFNQEYQQLLNELFAANQPLGPPPTAKGFLDGLPKAIIADEDKNAVCSVCQDSCKVGDELVELPCQHSFHVECVTPWLKDRNTCPTCRHVLPADEQAQKQRQTDQQEKLRVIEGKIAALVERAQAAENARHQEYIRRAQADYQRRYYQHMHAVRMQQLREEELRRQAMEDRQRRECARNERRLRREAEVYRRREERIQGDIAAERRRYAVDSYYEEDGIRVRVTTCEFERLYGPCEVPAADDAGSGPFTSLTCGHSFHTGCLDQSLRITREAGHQHFKCPTCLKEAARVVSRPRPVEHAGGETSDNGATADPLDKMEVDSVAENSSASLAGPSSEYSDPAPDSMPPTSQFMDTTSV